ncbi:MAG: NAD-dependent succinate-semialdehyde dehydrogenase [Acidobacteriaceae bacterium]|nr:NAD-dependent succinate-semialdehyde dehydrogenase [Acidobacteriota bacterium]MBV8809096.1 NAD-dependent succinate-semialdehyde dehydrogenase [Acidobacteriaceae bacterium]
MSSHTQLFIDGSWRDSSSNATLTVLNPSTEQAIGTVSRAERSDLDLALDAAQRGFFAWREISAFERSKIMRTAADLIRSRADTIARTLTVEQGKPLAEARAETLNGADIIDWFAEECRRTYGRVIPPRVHGIYQLVIREPVGPVAAFSPWNFPINQAVRKIAIALAAGCSVILKGPEETPGPCAELVRAFDDAGVVRGAVNLVFGVPAEISDYLIAHPTVRKISFTGSTAVGKRLAALAGMHMKRITMELGGHAPVIIFDDADIDIAAKVMAASKYRNAGQVCIAPTRFLVQEKVYDLFLEKFVTASNGIRVGDGLQPGTTMGPLAHERRLQAVENFVDDAVEHGAEIETGGNRIGSNGYYFSPTVLTHTSQNSRVMNDEPFGPVAVMIPFSDFDGAVAEANRLPYGLAAYAWTKSAKTANLVGAAVESGMVSINHVALAMPEVPFGGIKDSGYGSEGGSEAIEAYLNSKFVTQAGL